MLFVTCSVICLIVIIAVVLATGTGWIGIIFDFERLADVSFFVIVFGGIIGVISGIVASYAQYAHL